MGNHCRHDRKLSGHAYSAAAGLSTLHAGRISLEPPLPDVGRRSWHSRLRFST
ncbi:hypothetical protein DBT46_003785 [Aerococcus mictus]|uniref:hypothetical protein n=1 Tax=Aerococcus mictus TaxID=2976810 RepID=UPI002FD779A9